MTYLDPCNRAVAEEAVHPLDDLWDHLLDQRRVGGGNDELHDAFGFLAGWEADGFWRAHARVMGADDFRPTRHDRALHKAEAPKGCAADLRQQLADGLRRAATRACVGFGWLSLCGPLLGGTLAGVASHNGNAHAIAAA